MRILVVYAHPLQACFTGDLLRAFCEGARAAGHEVEVADLYAEGFDPLLDAHQFAMETAMEPDTARPEDVCREQDRLDGAEGLVFIYPFWWSDAPAILKGWFDRVWSYGYAYAYEADRTRRTRLTIRKALAICPAGHSDEKLDALGLRSAHHRVMVEDRLLGVGIPEARLELMGGLSGNPSDICEQHLAKAHRLGRTFADQ